jgi:hypothetical protein
MSRHHVHLSYVSDPEQYVRRWEHLAYQHWVRASQSLANMPIDRRATDAARKRVEAAKADFAQAWRALDGVTR